MPCWRHESVSELCRNRADYAGEMPDVTVGSLDDFPSLGRGNFIGVRQGLGVSSFGINVERWPPNSPHYPEHDEVAIGQEEVYTALEGSATLVVDGERFELRPGVFARVGPGARRKVLPLDDGVVLLCLGGVPGGVYRPSGPGVRL
jgi:hypothetical protein